MDNLREEHKTEAENLKEDLKHKLQTAAEQHEAKLRAEINKGKPYRAGRILFCTSECCFQMSFSEI